MIPDKCQNCGSGPEAWLDSFYDTDSPCFTAGCIIICLECHNVVLETDYEGRPIEEQ